ncbi:putative polyketide synthase [Mycobacterium kansasii]|uniref:Putative polyketide synthase n=1 Tax=Mycobacterium kansasii TaxID=1768 RepID=A0A1V3XSH6_MYCKA|nr:putative polyketide synthase [Mycobacterium kansasii]
MLYRQHGFDEAGDAGRRLGVAEIGLDGADEQGSVLGAARPSTVPRARASIGSPNSVPVP